MPTQPRRLLGLVANPICSLPFDEPIANDLAGEFAEQRFGRRFQALRKAAFRELVLGIGGQRRRRVARVPAGTSAMLWVYSWTTVGDAVMDLAPRVLVPRGIDVDLLITPALAPLFVGDRRLRAVHTDPKALPLDFDFILLDSLRTTSVRLKARSYPKLPFATMRGHNAGERFDRAAFADRRIRQLFGLPAGDVVVPSLELGDRRGAAFNEERFRIAVVLGARVAHNRYAHWNELLARLVAAWPAGIVAPQFRFLGQGSRARKDLQAIDADLVARHGVVELDAGDLRKTALDLAGCDAFLGVDGGLMHVAVAVATPGVALFARIDPAWRLRPGSTMRALRSAGDVSDIGAAQVAAEFLAALPDWLRRARALP